MLLELSIENLAIIDRLELHLSPGLNVLTGETGAGKSIIIDTVSLLLGGKGGPELVRTGAEDATCEALFAVSHCPGIAAFLEESGFDVGDSLVVRRKISRAGRSRAFLNGGMASLNVLAGLREQLINVCGQHESQSLLKRDRHLEVLEAFGKLKEIKADYVSRYWQYREMEKRVKGFAAGVEEREERAGLLRHQITEIEGAELSDGEEEELKERRKILLNAHNLATLCAEALELLYNQRGATVESLGRASERLSRMAEMDPGAGPWRDRALSAEAELSDLAVALQTYLARLDFEPGELERVDARLDLISRLKRKYGASVTEIKRYLSTAKAEHSQIVGEGQSLREMEGRAALLRGEVCDLAFRLLRERASAGLRLSEELAPGLKELGMEGASFAVLDEAGRTAQSCAGPADYPFDRWELKPDGPGEVEFLFTANPGEELKPLLKAVSGGELSRITLALKQLLSGFTGPSTLIFDEVDVGIGGSVSEVVARRLKELSRENQVICVTHLAQIARLADSHFVVEKDQRGGRTIATVREVKGKERVEELARMLGGLEVTEATRRHARELLKEVGGQG